METIGIVVSEILGFLAIAWLLGFFVAWAIFRPIQLEYKKELEESEESIDYLKSINRNQEKEITRLTIELQELSNRQHNTKEFLETQKRNHKKYKQHKRKELTKSKDSILQMIEATLEKIN